MEGLNPRSLTRLCSLCSGVAVLISGCASGPGGVSSQYSTAYLGPDGRILYSDTRPSSGSQKAVYVSPTPEPQWEWFGDVGTGAPSIVVDLSSQTATFYRGDTVVGRSPVSTGREGYDTPTGSFSLIQKNPDHVSNLYGDYVDSAGNVVVPNVAANRDRRPPGAKFRGAPMPYFMRVTGAVGLHAGYLPGYPASHGCIRMPKAAAAKFFEAAPLGTPVKIVH